METRIQLLGGPQASGKATAKLRDTKMIKTALSPSYLPYLISCLTSSYSFYCWHWSSQSSVSSLTLFLPLSFCTCYSIS